MLIEYDLVIIGATELGCQMAIRARSLGARVAIVEQNERPDGAIRFRQWLTNNFSDPKIAAIELQDALRDWTPAALQLQGIDYLASSGTWVKHPKSGFQVGDRLLRSSHFVCTLTPKRRIPVALWKIPHVLPEAFPLAEPIGKQVAIVGEAIVGVELAMALVKRGIDVTLIVPTEQILPRIPGAGAFRIQMMLEAAGVKVLSETRLRSAENLSERIQLSLTQKIGDRTLEQPLEVDQVILATAFERLDAERLGLRSLTGPALRKLRLRLMGSSQRVNLRWSKTGHGPSQQEPFDGLTSNARSIALLEVDRILKPWKSLPGFGRLRSVLAGQLNSLSMIWIGKAIGGEEPYVLTGKLENGLLWYYLKLDRKGQIQTAVLIGETAVEFGPFLGLAMHRGISIDNLLTLPLGNSEQTRVIQHWVQQWEDQQRPSLRHELFLDGLAFWRRRSK